MLIVGEGPHVLTLAYYALCTNTDLKVDIAVPEGEKFIDKLLGTGSPFTERMLTSLGCNILTLRDVKDLAAYDKIIDVMSYTFPEPGDHTCVEGLGALEAALAEKHGLPLHVPENHLDSDVAKYVMKRCSKIVETQCERPLCITYGQKHVDHPKCMYVGYGMSTRQGGILTDPVNVHRHCILVGLVLGLRLDEDIRDIPTWRGARIENVEILTLGLTTSELLKRGIMTTSISISTEDAYIKLLTVYRQNIAGVQVASASQVEQYMSTLYGLYVADKYTVLKKMLFLPTLFRLSFRTWIDSLVELSIREMYWLFYTT